MHDVDHAIGFKYFWDKLPMRPSNNDSWTQYFVSMYRNSFHQQIWVAANTVRGYQCNRLGFSPVPNMISL